MKNAILTFTKATEINGFHLYKDQDIILKTVPYEQLIGKIVYANEMMLDFINDDFLFTSVDIALVNVTYIE